MALRQDVREEMENQGAAEKLNQNEPVAAPQPAPEPDPEPIHTPEPVQKTPEPVQKTPAAPATTPAAPDGAALAKINQRLAGLEQDLADLMDDFDKYANRTFNYGPIFTKLEAVQADLEKLMAPKPEPEPAPQPESPSRLEDLIQKLLEKQESNDRQLVRCLRENANFQVQVRQQMQGDLEDLREQQTGSLFNPILKEISAMYADYQMILKDEGMDPKTRKNVQSLFSQMEDLLLDYEAEVCASKVGDERPKNRCRIINKIPTGNKALHNTVAKSLKPGVVRGRLVLAYEFVDVYVYDPALDEELNAPKVDPIVEPPVEQPVNPDPTTEPPAEQAPAGDAPAEQDPTEQPPVEQAPAQEAPTEETPAEQTPAKEAPAEEAPAEETPAAQPPVEEAPAQEAPAAATPAAETPAEPVRKPSLWDKLTKK